ncbi:hypothetical protein [Bryobacter aggregatus]|uniref:hypothetical protein n=1 Tax=Bryobacter aggregatus TaxID=360054 RepID=UPI0004E1D53A|nr:hypothetical protein [Bryobacter aggregatus]
MTCITTSFSFFVLTRVLSVLILLRAGESIAFATSITSGEWFEPAALTSASPPNGCQPQDLTRNLCLTNTGTPVNFLSSVPMMSALADEANTLMIVEGLNVTEVFAPAAAESPEFPVVSAKGKGACGDKTEACLAPPDPWMGGYFLDLGHRTLRIVLTLTSDELGVVKNKY